MSSTLIEASENFSQAMRQFGVSIAQAAGAFKALGKAESLLAVSQGRNIVKLMKRLELNYRDTPYTIEDKIRKLIKKTTGFESLKPSTLMVYGMRIEDVSNTIWKIVQETKEKNRPTVRKLRE